MKDQRQLLCAAITGLMVLSAPAASAADSEKCFGVARAGQNGCNSNVNKHSCAGRAKIDNDPKDFMPVPSGSCLKLGGKLEPAASSAKK